MEDAMWTLEVPPQTQTVSIPPVWHDTLLPMVLSFIHRTSVQVQVW